MKKIILKEMSLVSFREKRARRVLFDPKVTIVRGNNETGKSSLIKSILRTFGAEPSKVHPRWLEAEVRSLVRFEIDGLEVSLLRNGTSFAAFDAKGTVLGQFQSVTKDLAPFLAKLFSFGLTLPDHLGASIVVPPAYYFVPFYMDQDASWSQGWNAFKNLGQIPRWKQSAIEYHSGIRGNEFYQKKGQKSDAEAKLADVRRRREGLNDVYGKLSEHFVAAQFNVDFTAYGTEVEELLDACRGLRLEQEKFKARISELRIQRHSLESQRTIVARARDEFRQDHEHASELLADDVECPTCGAHYDNSFAARFSIALDEGRCAGLADEISEALSALDVRISTETERYSAAAAKLEPLSALLVRKQGELALVDLIRQEGRNELRQVVAKEAGLLEGEEGALSSTIGSLQKEMNAHSGAKRRKEVNSFYAAKMQTFLAALDVNNLPESSYSKVDAQFVDTGSELPRALLASQMAFLHVIQQFGTSAFAPVIIDSPNQQDQDDPHQERILTFIQERRPQDAQLVLGLVNAPHVNFGGTEILLESKSGLLVESEYGEVSQLVRAFMDAAQLTA